jgi:hypothetical protein
LSQPEKIDPGAAPVKYIATEQTIFYKLGDRILPIRVLQYGNQKGIVCINLHSNESTSVQAAMSVMPVKGGTLIKIENEDQRNIRFPYRGVTYEFDPNAIFSRIGIERTLKENHRSNSGAIEEIEKFSRRLL